MEIKGRRVRDKVIRSERSIEGICEDDGYIIKYNKFNKIMRDTRKIFLIIRPWRVEYNVGIFVEKRVKEDRG